MTVSSVESRPRPTQADSVPCAQSYARLAEVLPGLRVRLGRPPGRGWLTTAGLLADPVARAALIAEESDEGLARYGEPLRPEVAAGFALHRYAWPVCLLFSLPWFLERRVPLLPAERVALRRSGGGSLQLAVRPAGFSCLPDDPAAGLPGARVVADERALDAELRAAVAGHLTPVLTAFRTELRRGPRGLWALATDELVEGLRYAAGLLGEERRAALALTALLPGGTAPFTGGAGFHGESPATRTRVSCCLYYTVRPAEICSSCPRTCPSK